MDELKIGKFGRIERQQNLKSITIDGSKFRKVGRLENCEIDEEGYRQGEERLCRSIIKASRDAIMKDTMLADMEEEQEQDALTTSLARSCRGVQCAKLENWN